MSHELARVATFLPRRPRYDTANSSDLYASTPNADFMLQNTRVTDSFSVNVEHEMNIFWSPVELQIVRPENVFAPAEKFFLFRRR